MDRLLTAYQEELITLDELRRKMPILRQQEQAIQAELRAIIGALRGRRVGARHHH